jgi:2-C-methyl-D-erythritol 4-phosphate cytidylyltransferase
MASFAVIVPAAGKSTRFGDPRTKKIERELQGRPVWQWAIAPFLERPDVCEVRLAVSAEDREGFARRHARWLDRPRLVLVEGGAERHDTVARGLEGLPSTVTHVAVHDAARPCVDVELIERVFAAAVAHGAAVPGVAVVDTLRRVDPDNGRTVTVPRADLYAIQTPQVFRRDWIERAYAQRDAARMTITDDAQLVEAEGHPCVVVPGSRWNVKITTPEDLELAELFLGRAGSIGRGVDQTGS